MFVEKAEYQHLHRKFEVGFNLRFTKDLFSIMVLQAAVLTRKTKGGITI